MKLLNQALTKLLSARTVFCIMLSFMISTVSGQGEWGAVEENCPPRHGHSMVTLSDDRVVMFGGEDENADLFNDLNIYQDNDWDLVEPNNDPPEARRDHDGWVYDGKMYIKGGIGENQQLLNDLWSYDPHANIWEEIFTPDPKPGPRTGEASVVSEDGIVIITGGEAPVENQNPDEPLQTYELNDTWVYDIEANNYKQHEDVPHHVKKHKMFKFDGKYYIIQLFYGGSKMFRLEEGNDGLQWTDFEPTANNCSPEYSLAASSVLMNLIAPSPDLPKTANDSQRTTGAFRMGGLALRNIDNKWVYEISSKVDFFDFSTETWSQKEDMPFALMEATAYYDAQNNRIKVYGGLKADSTINEEVLVYQLPTTSIETTIGQPDAFRLSQNYPNPFNPETTIEYFVPKRGFVHLSVYDITGRKIVTLVNDFQDRGQYQSVFNGSGLSSGIYYYRLQAADFSQTRKLLFMN